MDRAVGIVIEPFSLARCHMIAVTSSWQTHPALTVLLRALNADCRPKLLSDGVTPYPRLNLEPDVLSIACMF
jgi:hypothetical protein